MARSESRRVADRESDYQRGGRERREEMTPARADPFVEGGKVRIYIEI